MSRASAKSLRDNAVAANTLAIAANGTLTGAGAIDFGSQDEPQSPWNQGLGIIIGSVLYVIEDITGAKLGAVSRLGAITSGFAEEDDVALASVSATQSWELVQMGVEESYQGRVSLAGGKEYAGTTVSTSVNVILFPRRSFPESEKLSDIGPMSRRSDMTERLKGADALALLEENVGSVMGEIPINGKIAEVEFRVPVGEEATALQEDVVGFVLKIEAGGTEEHNLKHAVPAWTVINKWGHKLMVTHGVAHSSVLRSRHAGHRDAGQHGPPR